MLIRNLFAAGCFALSLFSTHVFAATSVPLAFGTTYGGVISEPGERGIFVFNVAPGQRLYYDALDADFDNIRVGLIDPGGASLYSGNADNNRGVFVLTTAGEYSLIFTADGDVTGDYQFRLLDLSAATPLTMGTTVTNQLSPRTATHTYRFPGQVGQKVRLRSVSSGGAGFETQWRLISPGNQVIGQTVSLATDLGDLLLPVDGTYYLLVEGSVTNAAPLLYQFSIADVSEAPVAVSGLDVERSGTINAGQTNTFSFTAPAGLPVYFDSEDRTTTLSVEVLDPTTNQVFSVATQNDGGPYVLPRSGTYTLRVRGFAPTDTGSYRFRLLNLNAASLLPLNTNVTATLGAPYKTDVYKLSLAANQRLFYDALDNDFDQVSVRLLAPDGGLRINGNSDSDGPFFSVGAAGTYYLFLESSIASTPDYSFRLLDLASYSTLPLDQVVSGTIDPGRSVVIYQINGVAGQRLFFNSTATGTGDWALYDPANGQVSGGASSLRNDLEVTLPIAGTYGLVISGNSASPVPYSFTAITFDRPTNILTLNTTINGTISEPGEQDLYTFTGTAGQQLYYDALDGDFDQISVQLVDPTGQVSSINHNSDSDVGPFTLALSGAYTVLIDGSGEATGDYSFRLLDVTNQATLPLDQLVSGTLDPGRSAAIYQFNGTVGQRLFFNTTMTGTGDWALYHPGNRVVSGGASSLRSDLEVTLPTAGTYTLVLSGNSASPVPYLFTAVTFDTPTNLLTLNAPLSGTITEPGEQRLYRFNATAGQRLYYDALDGDFDQISVQLVDPAGQVSSINHNSDSDVGPFTLAQNGIYTLVIDGNGDTTGDYSFRLLDVSSQATLSFDQVVNGTLDPGRSATIYQFNGVAGQRLFFNTTAASATGDWALYDPGNRPVSGGASSLRSDLEVTLPIAGAYTLVLSGNSASPVPYSFTVVTFDTPTNLLTLNTTVSGIISEPGEQDLYTFTGTAGQRLYYDALDTDFDQINVQLINPSGQVVFLNGNSDSDVGPFTLVQSGTYTLVIDGSGDTIADYSFRLVDLSSVPSYTLGTTFGGSLDPRIETDISQFAGVLGQRLSFKSISASANQANWRLVGQADQTITSGNIASDLQSVTLPATGNYHLLIEGNTAGAAPLNYQVMVSDISDAPVTASGLGNVEMGTLGAGQTNVVNFTVPAGTWIYFDSQDVTATSLVVDLRDPTDTLITVFAASSDSGPHLLLRSGAYTARVRGASPSNAGSYRFRILDLVNGVPTLALNTTTNVIMPQAYQTDVYRFTGAAGQRLVYDALESDFEQVRAILFNPLGNVVHINGNADSDAGPFALLVPGTYWLAIQNILSTPTHYAFRLLDAAAQPVLPFETVVNGTLNPGFATAIYQFNGTNGQRLFFDAQATSGSGAGWTLYGPNNTSLNGSGSIQVDFQYALTVDGTYLLVLAGNVASTVPFSFQTVNYRLLTNNLVLGNTVSNVLSRPGEQHVYQFTGMAGQRLFYDALDGDFDNIRVALVNPGGSIVSVNGNSDNDVGPFTLAESGQYALVVYGSGDTIGNYIFRLLDATAQPVLPFDTVVNGTLNPGFAAAIYRFNGTNGQRLFFDSQASSGSGAGWTLYGPNNTSLNGSGSIQVDFQHTLPLDGTYLLVLANNVASTVPYSFQAVNYRLLTNNLVLGNTVSNVLSRPGEQHVYQFSGTAGQRLFYDALDGDFDNIRVLLVNPGGSIVSVNGNSDNDVGPFALAESGQYALVVYGSGDTIGNYAFRLLDAAAQPVLPFHTTVNGTLNPGFAAAIYRFSGTNGQRLFFDSQASSSSGAGWTLYGPNNTSLNGSGAIQSDFQYALTLDGTYLLVLAGNVASAVNYSFRVATPNEGGAVSANRAPMLALISDQTTGEGVNLTFTVSATDPDAGDRLSFSVDPGGPAGATINSTNGLFSWTPPVTGFSYFTNITVRVTDTGSPKLSAAQTFTVKVVGGPVMIGVQKFETSTTVLWRTAPDRHYQLQYSDPIAPPRWANLGSVVTAVGFISSQPDNTIGTNSQRYYRVQFLDPP